MSSSPPLLELRNVEVHYDGKRALDLDRFAIERGRSLVLLGHNGAGKSTLLRILGLLERPTHGVVVFDGEPAPRRGRALLAARRRIANVLQQPLLCRTSVTGNVAMGLRFRGVPAPERRRRADVWMKKLRLADFAERRAETLSGGEAQRTSLARALVLEPDLLLLDEPFAALDAPTRSELLADLRMALAGTGTTVVFATHDRNDALALADDVAVLSAGGLLQIGPPAEVFGRPASEEVARFVGAETLIAGTTGEFVAGVQQVETDAGSLHVATEGVSGDVFVCIRPENVHLFSSPQRPSHSARNALEGSVTEIRELDSHLQVMVDCGAPVSALITRAARAELGIEVGTRVWAAFKATAAHLVPR